MSPMEKVHWLAGAVGCPIVERDASESWNFDGTGIAAYRSVEKEDDDGNVIGQRIDRYLPHDLLHEVAHYCVAEECQRDLPEYGCSIGIVNSLSLGPKGGEFRDEEGNVKELTISRADRFYDGLVDSEEQDIQELAAQMMCHHIGWFLGIPMDLLSAPKQYTDRYQAEKIKERNKHYLKDVRNLKDVRKCALKGIRFLRSKVKR